MEEMLLPAALALLVAALPIWWYDRRWKNLYLPPGSLGWPVLGETLRMLRCLKSGDADCFFAQRRKRHGSLYKTHLFGSPCVVVSGPKAAALLATSEDTLLQSNQPLPYRKLLGAESIVNVVAHKHRLFRRVLNDKFMGEHLAGYLGRVESVALEQMEPWRTGDARTMDAEAYRFTFNIIAATALSWGPGHRFRLPASQMTRLVTTALVDWPLDCPGFPFRRGMHARRRLDHMFQTEITQRRSGEIVRDDLLAQMMAARCVDLDSAKPRLVFNDQQLKDTLQMLVIGGHDPTANTLTWIVNLLSRHPHCYHRLLAEHEEIRSTKALGEPLTWEDINKMSYTTKVILEALRVSSIAFVVQRNVKQDFQLDGYDIPRGWKLILDAHELHHNPQNYSDPQTFDPSRFDNRAKPYTFMPFGVGPRMCLGKDMAMLQMRVFLHHMLLNYKWTITDEDVSRLYRGPPTLRNGVPFRLDAVHCTTV